MPADKPAHVPPAAARPVRPVVPFDWRERRRRESARELRRSPGYLLVAASVHALLFAWWSLQPAVPVVVPAEMVLRADTEELAPPLPEEPPELLPPELPPAAPPPEDQLLVGEPVVQDLASLADFDPRPAMDVLGLGGGAGGGGGGGRRSALAGQPVELVSTGPGGGGFRLFVDELRGRGLDMVFVVDCTASMDKFIAQARATIDDIIGDLSAVVPDLRVGLVAYRDQQDLWTTRKSDLTDNRYLIHNFLLDLQADGGGDFEEAVQEGLRVAIHDLSWRPDSRRVLLLVGDAPAHAQDEPVALSLVRGFARERDAALSVLYTGGTGTAALAERDRAVRESFTALVRAGGGLLFELGDDHGDLQAQILDASFGTEWRDEIRALLTARTADLRTRIVRLKVLAGDRAWLIGHLEEDPPHPAVVEGCIELFDVAIAQLALALVADETRTLTLRAAALYVLRKKVAPGVALDVAQPLSGQLDQLARLRREVDRLVPAPGRQQPPPPPPGPRR